MDVSIFLNSHPSAARRGARRPKGKAGSAPPAGFPRSAPEPPKRKARQAQGPPEAQGRRKERAAS
eukprot:scaffold1782_cov414-Prasinococcus_capsulatus_cf.AAC.29